MRTGGIAYNFVKKWFQLQQILSHSIISSRFRLPVQERQMSEANGERVF